MKKIISVLIVICLMLFPFYGCNKSDKNIIRLNEVTHSVFYTPLYLAIENGYFSEENITIELTNGGGANNSMTAILSKSADIGLMGPETVIYVLNQGKTDAPKVFAQLTQKDGAFLVSRNDEPNFKWSDLQGKEILAGRQGGVPAMSFEYILNSMSMYDGTDFTLNYNVQFNLMTSAFLNGTADYCTVFEPTASEYQKNGLWYIVASVGEQGGEIPYTSFIALSSYLNNNQDIVKGFLRALKKAFDFMKVNTDYDIASAIVKQFPSTTILSLETSIKNYRLIDAWKTNMQTTESSFTKLQDIMENAGELAERVDFADAVDLSLASEIFN